MDSLKGKPRKSGSLEEARKHLKYSEDLGTELVQDAEGYVFNLNVLKKSTDKKKITNIISGAIAEQLARTEVTSECECVYKNGLFPAEDCELKNKKQRPTLVKIESFSH